MRFILLSAAALAAVSLAAADSANAGSKAKKRAKAPTNAELLERIRVLEDALLEMRGGVPGTVPRSTARAKAAGAQPAKPAAVAQQQPRAMPAPPAAQPVATAEQRAVTPGLVTFDPAIAERALERALVATGATLLRPMALEIEPFVAFASNSTDSVQYITNGGGLVTNVLKATSEVRNVVTAASVRLGLPWNMQVEATVPYVFRNAETKFQEIRNGVVGLAKNSSSVDGLGDISVALAATVLQGSGGWPDLIARLVWDSDTGEKLAGGQSLGSGFNEVRGEIVAVKRQDPLVFVMRGSYSHAFEKNNAQPGDSYGLSLESYLAVSPKTSLKVGLSYDYSSEFENAGLRVAGTDSSRASLTFGGNTIIDKGLVLSLNGSAGLTKDAPDFTVQMGLSYRLN